MVHARPDYNRIQDPASLIPDDEPVFLIRAQDSNSAEVVRAWADINDRNGGDIAMSDVARDHADLMDRWPNKKIPDMDHGGV